MQDEKDKEEAFFPKLGIAFLENCGFLYYLLQITIRLL